jgi:signal peptidase II
MRATPREEIIGRRFGPDGGMTRWGVFLGIAALVFLADRITKYLVTTRLAVGEMWNPIPLLRPFFTVTHVTNTGAAFGLFREFGLFFAVVAVVVVVGIIAFYRFLPPGEVLLNVSLGLQLGGALGNLVDRLLLGSVVDFLDFKLWPVFNVADMAIVSGVAILAFHLLFGGREGERIAEELD